MQGRGLLLGLLAVALLPGVAAAEDRGPGVRAGAVEIHPSVSLEGGYDNNVFYDSTTEGRSPPNAATVLQVGGGLTLENRNASNIGFELAGRFLYRHLTSLDDPDGRIDDRVVEARNGLASASGRAMLALLPQSSVTLELHENLRYSERPSFETTAVGFEKLDNAAGADLRFRPGGRALELRLGYRYRVVDFLEETEAGSGRAEKNAHEARLLTLWRWLPKTSFVVDMQYGVIDYARPQERLTADGGFVLSADRDSRPFRLEAGLRGLLTQRISVVAMAGYLNTFNVVGNSFNGVVGRLEVNYVVEPTLSVGVGYRHDASDSSFSNFYRLDEVFARLDLHFLSRFEVGGRVGYDFIKYDPNGAPGGIGREDPVLRAQAHASYSVREWLSAGLEWQLENNTTEYRSPPGEANPDLQDHADYSRQLVLLKLTAEY
ncbi:MAG: outer membrane beta-barrel protein [Myxococcales bacterium]|nr:outer membrane beta-barrel protein [Myxococcales bacterium]MCB9547272.1 outer membrane beta-barrel protein [Myxococcales bacterium]